MIGCISFNSYIKPQLCSPYKCQSSVVYHLIPTSNHNPFSVGCHHEAVVYHLIPTSNHNFGKDTTEAAEVVYHLIPTSNHNDG